ncbi:MAG: ribonuclease Z, partial [Bacteroidota bacterium]
EATFMHASADIARHKMHSTTVEAATLAKKAQVGKLMIGHYSARYKEMKEYLEEASGVFPETIMAEEGQTIPV